MTNVEVRNDHGDVANMISGAKDVHKVTRASPAATYSTRDLAHTRS